MAAIILFIAPRMVDAQGLVKGVETGRPRRQQGRRSRRRCSGWRDRRGGRRRHRRHRRHHRKQRTAGADAASRTQRQGRARQHAKAAKAPAKGTKAATPQPPPSKPSVLTQKGAPQLTADQIVANSDSYIERIKTELNLTPDQEKNWSGFSSAMHYLGHNGAERLNLRIARAKRDPPDDIVEQMRNEAQFLVDRAADQRNVADAAEPLFASLDDKQKQVFIEEMVRLSHERGLD